MKSNESRRVELPEPWEDWTITLSPEIPLLGQLEEIYVGGAGDSPGETSTGEPIVGRSGLKWVLVKNRDTGVRIIIGMTQFYVGPGYRYALKSVSMEPMAILFFSGTSYIPLSGTDMRQIPIQSICSAYSLSYGAMAIESNRQTIIGDKHSPMPESMLVHDLSDAIKPLPAKYSRQAWFYVLVAVQYDSIELKYPNTNVVEKMVEINRPVAKSTVQRWVTKARNLGVLAPVRLVK